MLLSGVDGVRVRVLMNAVQAAEGNAGRLIIADAYARGGAWCPFRPVACHAVIGGSASLRRTSSGEGGGGGGGGGVLPLPPPPPKSPAATGEEEEAFFFYADCLRAKGTTEERGVEFKAGVELCTKL